MAEHSAVRMLQLPQVTVVEKSGELNWGGKVVKATDIAWLGGIIDGEGCVYARQISLRGLTFHITIETVSETMIDKVRDILDQCGVEFRIEPPIWRERSTRFAHRLKVDKKRAVHKLCNLILPYSVVKKT